MQSEGNYKQPTIKSCVHTDLILHNWKYASTETAKRKAVCITSLIVYSLTATISFCIYYP